MARPMTATEKVQYQAWFPALDVNAAVVTAENDPVYNCISWTVGVTNTWHWPGNTIQAFDTFYAGFGFVRRPSGPIAVWGHDLQSMLHGSVSGPGHGPRWESKCGGLLRIQHGKNELQSETYGHIVAFYRRPWLCYFVYLIALIGRRKFKLKAASVRALDEAVDSMDPALRGRFEERFKAWQQSWRDPDIQIHSDPAAVRRAPEFDELVALGPETLPAVARKLAEPENFFALQLYEALLPAELRDEAAPAQAEPADGEQGRAQRTAARFAAVLGKRQRPA